MKRPNTITGFTLIELLTVIAISAVVSTIGLNILTTVNAHYLKTNKQVQLSNKVAHALDRMQTDLEEIIPTRLASQPMAVVNGYTSNRVYREMGDCQDDVLTLPVAVMDALSGQVTSQTVSYYIDRSASLPRLMFATAPLGETPVRAQAQVLVNGAWQFQVEFSDGQGWSEEWTQSTHPDAVRVNLVVSDESRIWEQVSRKRVFTIRVK